MDAASNNADKTKHNRHERCFDNYVDDAVVKGLFEGEADAISKLKDGDRIWDYMKKFSGGKGDTAGKFIEKIIKETRTRGCEFSILQSVDLIKLGPQICEALQRQILGTNSEGWKSIRQAAFKQLIKTHSTVSRSLAEQKLLLQ